MTEQTSNGFAAAQRWVGEIEKHLDSVQDVMMRALRDCQPYHEMIREAKAAAKAEGISIKLLNGALKERKLLRAVVKNRSELDEDIADDFEEFVAALEPVKDLPLFGAAISAAENRQAKKSTSAKAKSDAIDSLTDDEFDQADPAKVQIADNVTKLRGGIQPLN